MVRRCFILVLAAGGTVAHATAALPTVGILGEVESPGVYAFDGASLPVSELVAAVRLKPNASRQLRIVRQGRTGHQILWRPGSDERVLPGDLIVVPGGAAPKRKPGENAGVGTVVRGTSVATTPYDSEATRLVAVVDLFDDPVLLEVPAERANPAGIQRLLGQTPGSVPIRVLLWGGRPISAETAESVAFYPTSTVLSISPDDVDFSTLPPPPDPRPLPAGRRSVEPATPRGSGSLTAPSSATPRRTPDRDLNPSTPRELLVPGGVVPVPSTIPPRRSDAGNVDSAEELPNDDPSDPAEDASASAASTFPGDDDPETEASAEHADEPLADPSPAGAPTTAVSARPSPARNPYSLQEWRGPLAALLAFVVMAAAGVAGVVWQRRHPGRAAPKSPPAARSVNASPAATLVVAGRTSPETLHHRRIDAAHPEMPARHADSAPAQQRLEERLARFVCGKVIEKVVPSDNTPLPSEKPLPPLRRGGRGGLEAQNVLHQEKPRRDEIHPSTEPHPPLISVAQVSSATAPSAPGVLLDRVLARLHARKLAADVNR